MGASTDEPPPAYFFENDFRPDESEFCPADAAVISAVRSKIGRNSTTAALLNVLTTTGAALRPSNAAIFEGQQT